MIHAFHDDGPRLGREDAEEAIVTDAEFVVTGADQPFEESFRTGGRLLQLRHDPTGNGRVQVIEVADRPLGPADRP